MERKTFNVSFIGEDIIYFNYKSDCHNELEDIVEAYALYEELSADKNLKVIVEFPEFTSMSSKARELTIVSEMSAQAEALVIASLSQKILARFYYRFNRKNHPVKVFGKTEKAVEWLNGF